MTTQQIVSLVRNRGAVPWGLAEDTWGPWTVGLVRLRGTRRMVPYLALVLDNAMAQSVQRRDGIQPVIKLKTKTDLVLLVCKDTRGEFRLQRIR